MEELEEDGGVRGRRRRGMAERMKVEIEDS